jgi:hypothetical protein
VFHLNAEYAEYRKTRRRKGKTNELVLRLMLKKSADILRIFLIMSILRVYVKNQKAGDVSPTF